MLRKIDPEDGPDFVEIGQPISFWVHDPKTGDRWYHGTVQMKCGYMQRFGEFVLIDTNLNLLNPVYVVEIEDRRMFYIIECFGDIKVVDLDVDNRIALKCTVEGYQWSDK